MIAIQRSSIGRKRPIRFGLGLSGLALAPPPWTGRVCRAGFLSLVSSRPTVPTANPPQQPPS